MKKTILSVFALTMLSTAIYAQGSAAPAAPADRATPQTEKAKPANDKKQVEASALPDGIKQQLATDRYKEWKIVTAWYFASSNQYLLEMQKGDEKTVLKFDKEGKLIS